MAIARQIALLATLAALRAADTHRLNAVLEKRMGRRPIGSTLTTSGGSPRRSSTTQTPNSYTGRRRGSPFTKSFYENDSMAYNYRRYRRRYRRRYKKRRTPGIRSYGRSVRAEVGLPKRHLMTHRITHSERFPFITNSPDIDTSAAFTIPINSIYRPLNDLGTTDDLLFVGDMLNIYKKYHVAEAFLIFDVHNRCHTNTTQPASEVPLYSGNKALVFTAYVTDTATSNIPDHVEDLPGSVSIVVAPQQVKTLKYRVNLKKWLGVKSLLNETQYEGESGDTVDSKIVVRAGAKALAVETTNASYAYYDVRVSLELKIIWHDIHLEI